MYNICTAKLHTCTQSDDAENADRMYDLVGVVVHCGRCVCVCVNTCTMLYIVCVHLLSFLCVVDQTEVITSPLSKAMATGYFLMMTSLR